MPVFVKGNMWDIYGKTGLFLITTNPIINAQGKLVMGRGIAKQFADKFPAAPFEFARLVETNPNAHLNTIYFEPFFGKQFVGYFMVKSHWREPARIDTIMRSTADLMQLASMYHRVDLNFPGIGNGHLSREQVKPLMDYLPDNVYIWEYEDVSD